MAKTAKPKAAVKADDPKVKEIETIEPIEAEVEEAPATSNGDVTVTITGSMSNPVELPVAGRGTFNVWRDRPTKITRDALEVLRNSDATFIVKG